MAAAQQVVHHQDSEPRAEPHDYVVEEPRQVRIEVPLEDHQSRHRAEITVSTMTHPQRLSGTPRAWSVTPDE